MFCPKCGFQNEDTATFCGRCGNPLSSSTPVMQATTAFTLNDRVIFCPQCGNTTLASSPFCGMCGAQLNAQRSPQPSQLSTLPSLLGLEGAFSMSKNKNFNVLTLVAIALALIAIVFIFTPWIETPNELLALNFVGGGVDSYTFGTNSISFQKTYSFPEIMSFLTSLNGYLGQSGGYTSNIYSEYLSFGFYTGLFAIAMTLIGIFELVLTGFRTRTLFFLGTIFFVFFSFAWAFLCPFQMFVAGFVSNALVCSLLSFAAAICVFLGSEY